MKWGKLEFDEESYNVTWSGVKIGDLTPKEIYILCYFMQNPKSLITREELLENVKNRNQKLVWPSVDDWPTIGTLSTHVNNLRKKIKKVSTVDFIITVHGIGYRLLSIPQA